MGCVSGARPGAPAQRAAAAAAAAAAAGGRRGACSGAATARVQGCGRVPPGRSACTRGSARALIGRAAVRALRGARAAACTRTRFRALARPSADGRGGARRVRQRPAGARCGPRRRRCRTGAGAGADARRAHAARHATCTFPNKALMKRSTPGRPSPPARPGPRAHAAVPISAVGWGVHPRAPCACAPLLCRRPGDTAAAPLTRARPLQACAGGGAAPGRARCRPGRRGPAARADRVDRRAAPARGPPASLAAARPRCRPHLLLSAFAEAAVSHTRSPSVRSCCISRLQCSVHGRGPHASGVTRQPSSGHRPQRSGGVCHGPGVPWRTRQRAGRVRWGQGKRPCAQRCWPSL
jgi:hypothetical protein